MELKKLMCLILGFLLVGGTVWFPFLQQNGFEAVGPILGIMLIVFSLFGELPFWLSWTTSLGCLLYSGVVVATVLLLLPLLIPTVNHESSFFAFSPSVWAAYLSI